MQLYDLKKRSKYLLFVLALAIVGVSLWYSNRIVSKIRQEERKKVELWSKAIQNRAQLVTYTKRLFDKLQEEEKKKVKHWFEATSVLTQSDDIPDSPFANRFFTFLTGILEDNTTIPIIITDNADKVLFKTNLDEDLEKADSSYIATELTLMKAAHPPLIINYYGNEKQFLYYRNSQIFRELQEVMDNIINSFISETVINSASVPVIFTDATKTVLKASGNIDPEIINDSTKLQQKIAAMELENNPIELSLDGEELSYIFYEDSNLLTQLKFYPVIMLISIALFLGVSYLLFNSFRKSEQNQVWVGMAKETAHQIGTPLSSLMAWIELIKSGHNEPDMAIEMEKDLGRLLTITDRFSKIGSKPELKLQTITPSIQNIISYLKPRIPSKVTMDIIGMEKLQGVEVYFNQPLFEWVIENLCRNAVDATEGKGAITVELGMGTKHIYIDITDTGKGISANKQKMVFEPGYTTKKRGWGLGLSLTKRIIQNYHNGKIFVKKSEPGVGTTFRIELKKVLLTS